MPAREKRPGIGLVASCPSAMEHVTFSLAFAKSAKITKKIVQKRLGYLR